MAETVELMQEQVRDDAANTGSATPLSEVLAEEPVASETPAEPVQTEEPKEAGWIKTRIQKGIDKELPAIEARIRAEYEAKYAPLMEAHMSQEADRLVASGKIADREMALEYLKLRGGQPSVKQAEPQPRDEKGRFTSNEDAGQQKARELYLQAQTIQKSTGVDVMNLYHNDPEVKERVNSGEWDFSDVYKNTLKTPAPTVVRSGGGSFGKTDISKMSSEAFRKMNERLARGERFDARR